MDVLAVFFIRSGFNLVVFGLIFGTLSFMRTQRFRQRTGVNPWGLPPVAWGVASLFVALFGTLLSVIACATTRTPTGRGDGHPYGPSGAYRTGGAYRPGTAPGAAPGWGTPSPAAPAPPWGTAGAWSAGAPATPAHPVAAAPPSWHADPSGRHQHRYWDGAQWTHHVSNNGEAAVDGG